VTLRATGATYPWAFAGKVIAARDGGRQQRRRTRLLVVWTGLLVGAVVTVVVSVPSLTLTASAQGKELIRRSVCYRT